MLNKKSKHNDLVFLQNVVFLELFQEELLKVDKALVTYMMMQKSIIDYGDRLG